MRQRILKPSSARTARTSTSGEHAGETVVLDGTAIPAGPPLRRIPSKLPHGWRLLALVDVTSRQVLAVQLAAPDDERTT